jgi:hypothetical protein
MNRITMTNFTINVKLNLEEDARNYWRAFNANTHASKRKEQVAEITTIELQKLRNMKEKDVYPFLREYLENFWKEHTKEAEDKIKEMTEELNKHKDVIFKTMEKLTKHPIYRNDFTIFLTSLNRWPYKTNLWQTWSYIHWKWFVPAFTHELLHFQTIHYYKEYIMSKLHDEKKFEDLKEALTFLLNHEFPGMTDGWYPQHKELRKKLEDYRVHSDKDFDKLVEYGCDILLNE